MAVTPFQIPFLSDAKQAVQRVLDLLDATRF